MRTMQRALANGGEPFRELVNDARNLLRNTLDTRNDASQTPGPSMHTEDRERLRGSLPAERSRRHNVLHIHLDTLKNKPADPMRCAMEAH